jgi:hypothetical protein
MKNCDKGVPTSLVVFVAIVVGVLFVTSTASGLPLLPQQASAFNKLHHWIKWYEQRAIASIGQENNQNAVCISGSSTIGSCNQSASNFNSGNAVAANVGGGSGSSSRHHHGLQSSTASISQENDQRAVCISGSSTIGSCNQSASNFNSGNAVAANVGGGSDSKSSTASIRQENDQRAVCISGRDTTDSCNQLGINVNTGNTVAANVR